MDSPRRPTRLLDKSNITSAYPKELVADFETGELTLVDESGEQVATNPLEKVDSGSGNAVTAVTVEGRKITVEKGSTFLTQHPTISKESDSTSSANPGAGGTFTAVDSVTRDANGHVTKINTKTVTMPPKPTASELGCASTALYQATIGTTWSGSAAPYTQTIAVSGILATDTPIVDVNLSSISYSNKDSVIEAYSKVYRITTANNSITVYADDKTETAIPIQLKVTR